MDLGLVMAMGVAMSACCGFRLLIPPTVMAYMAMFGWLDYSGTEFAFLGSPLTVILLTVAALVEVGAYYLPWLDNLLDTMGAPICAFMGMAVCFISLYELPEGIQWAAAIVAGGGTALLTHTGTGLVRASSSVGTGGLGNALWATFELFLAVAGSLLSIYFPIVMGVCTFVLLIVMLLIIAKLWNKRRAKQKIKG